MDEAKIQEVRSRVDSIVGSHTERLLFVERHTIVGLHSVSGVCWPSGFITMTVTPYADVDLVVYATLHELEHRRQFADGMSLSNYRRDILHYELDAWTQADRWLMSAGVTKTLDMTAFAEACLSAYRRYIKAASP